MLIASECLNMLNTDSNAGTMYYDLDIGNTWF